MFQFSNNCLLGEKVLVPGCWLVGWIKVKIRLSQPQPEVEVKRLYCVIRKNVQISLLVDNFVPFIV